MKTKDRTAPDSNLRRVVFAADIGGTTTRLMLASAHDGDVRPLFVRHYHSQPWHSFTELLRDFLGHTRIARCPAPVAAGIAAAGPVLQQRCVMTNLEWILDANMLSDELGDIPVEIVNDFIAAAQGISALDGTDMETLQSGDPIEHGVRAVAGAGTGWGQAFQVWFDNRYETIGSEGGHADFSPTNAQQLEFVADLLTHSQRVTIEDILSGYGLVKIYRFLARRDNMSPTPAMKMALSENNAAAMICEHASSDSIANETIEWFAALYGSQLGNLALNYIPRGGLYIAGGIAPKILNQSTKTALVQSFLKKEPMRALLERIPLHLVTNPHLGLLGAALVADRTSVRA
ncbi:MAG: glucokinase [Gammaproteobacteria bacterium]|nr:glucokinase [Gammaproteobacteria bacterium]